MTSVIYKREQLPLLTWEQTISQHLKQQTVKHKCNKICLRFQREENLQDK